MAHHVGIGRYRIAALRQVTSCPLNGFYMPFDLTGSALTEYLTRTDNMTTWRDQVALVTGGARGIGRSTARLLAQRGAAVCVNYAAHADAADELVGEIAADGGRAISAMADVAEASAVEAIVARTEKELGPVTILVNNAGVSWQATLDTYDPEQVARMRQVNVEGLIHATRAVIGGMRARRYDGRIVNISSIAAIGTALPGNAFYAATKAEVAILTKRFALELGPTT